MFSIRLSVSSKQQFEPNKMGKIGQAIASTISALVTFEHKDVNLKFKRMLALPSDREIIFDFYVPESEDVEGLIAKVTYDFDQSTVDFGEMYIYGATMLWQGEKIPAYAVHAASSYTENEMYSDY